MQTACVTIIFKTLGLIRLKSISLIHEPWKQQIPKLLCANCLTIQLTVRACLIDMGCPGLLGRLFLPKWLLSLIKWARPAWSQHFYIKIGSSMHEQCVTCCPLSCFVHCRAARQGWLLRKFLAGIPASQYWDPS